MLIRRKNETNEEYYQRCKDRAKTLKTKNKVRSSFKRVSKTRRVQNVEYGKAREEFLAKYKTCVVTGEEATQVHHSAQRYGQWLLLKRYWVPVSAEGHRIIEENKAWAERRKLIVRITQQYGVWIEILKDANADLDTPIIVLDKSNLSDILEDIKNKVVK